MTLTVKRSAALTEGAARRRDQRLAGLEAERIAQYGSIVARRFYEIARIHAVVHHKLGHCAVTLFLIRDGHPVLPPQTFREPVGAILESREVVGDLLRGNHS